MRKTTALTLALMALFTVLFAFWSYKVVPEMLSQRESIQYQFPVTETAEQNEILQITEQISHLKTKLEKNKNHPEDLAQLSEAYLKLSLFTERNQDLEKARHSAENSLHIKTQDNLLALSVLAQVAQKQKQFKKSLALAERILRQSPYHLQAYRVLAQSHLGLGDLSEASTCADEFVRLNPGQESYSLRALILSEQGRDSEAVLDFKKALKNEKNNFRQAALTRTFYAQHELNRGKHESASDLIDEALRISPQSSKALATKAELFEKEQDYEKAALFYELAHQKTGLTEHLYNWARAAQLSGKVQLSENLALRAEKDLRAALENGKMSDRQLLIRLLLDRARPDDIKEALDFAQAEVLSHENSESLILLSRAYEKNQMPEAARNALRKLLNKRYRSAEIFHFASVLESKLNNTDLAQIYQDQIFQINPRFEKSPGFSTDHSTLATRNR